MPIFIPLTASHSDDVLYIWNAAAHPDYPLNANFLAYNTIPSTGEIITGRLAIQNGEAVAFVLACIMENSPLGWVSALAVHPSAHRQGLGSQLLTWAEGWLKEQGCQRIRIGGNLRPFLPGLPYAMRESLSFFERHGYQSPASQPYEYDIARSLTDYQPLYPQTFSILKPLSSTAIRASASPSVPSSVPSFTLASIAPMQPGQEPILLDFLAREYPGRWEIEAREFVRNGGRASDFLLLWLNGNVEGFCRLTLEDSERPIERFYPQRLPRPWGQFGPLGLSQAVRGQGLGGLLIDAAALHLQALGVAGCVIDWTSLVDLYGKFGFTLYNHYISLFKSLAP